MMTPNGAYFKFYFICVRDGLETVFELDRLMLIWGTPPFPPNTSLCVPEYQTYIDFKDLLANTRPCALNNGRQLRWRSSQ